MILNEKELFEKYQEKIYNRLNNFSILKTIGDIGDKNNVQLFAIGGFVRDLLLDRENYDDIEKVDIFLKLYQKLIEKTKEHFERLFEYFKFYNYLGDKMKEITKEQENEIKDKFDKMLDFLINNKNNDKYDNDQFNKVVENIKEVQKSKLFPFIFDDENIKNKIKNL